MKIIELIISYLKSLFEKKEEAGTPAIAPYTKTLTVYRSGNIYIDGKLHPKYLLPQIGTEYGDSLLVVFDTGKRLSVPDTSKDVNIGNMGYRPGGGLNNHPIANIPKAEVYGVPGDATSTITVHYKG